MKDLLVPQSIEFREAIIDGSSFGHFFLIFILKNFF